MAEVELIVRKYLDRQEAKRHLSLGMLLDVLVRDPSHALAVVEWVVFTHKKPHLQISGFLSLPKIWGAVQRAGGKRSAGLPLAGQRSPWPAGHYSIRRRRARKASATAMRVKPHTVSGNVPGPPVIGSSTPAKF